GYVDLKVVLIISLAFLFGSYFGSKIALRLPQDTIRKIFAVFMILIAIKLLFFDKKAKHVEVPASENGG
ncbi:MAG: sulfite exporter TauE/SafE family protein, partial [Bacteroidetes bacterium]|nr:sulfite exporter TauE/SafE family protein [Bacteroidota bacterium]